MSTALPIKKLGRPRREANASSESVEEQEEPALDLSQTESIVSQFTSEGEFPLLPQVINADMLAVQ